MRRYATDPPITTPAPGWEEKARETAIQRLGGLGVNAGAYGFGFQSWQNPGINLLAPVPGSVQLTGSSLSAVVSRAGDSLPNSTKGDV